MDTIKYKALIKSVEMGSLTNAASELGYTQAGLTHMMNRLEREIGCKLLKRDKYGVRLTEDGEKLLPLIKDFLTASEKLEKGISSTREHKLYTVKIASYTSIINHWLPSVIRKFKQLHPYADFEITDGSVTDIHELIYSGKADVGFVSRQENIQCEFIHLRDDPLLAVLPPDSPIGSNGKQVNYDEFNDVRFLMPSMGFDRDIMRALNKNGAKPQINRTSVSDYSVIKMVANGLGVSILSELILCDNTQDVKILPLEPKAHRELGLIYIPGVSKLTREFIDFCEDYIKSE